MIQKRLLDDVVVIRLLLVFLLVLHHSFCPFSGAWDPLPDVAPVGVYALVSAFPYHIFLPTFVFISGYLFGYNVNRNPDALTARKCIGRKIMRLYIPGIIFSAIYYLMFYDLHTPAWNVVYSVINGCGHLWFLPMLFWCFAGIYVVERLRLSPSLVLPLALCATVFHVSLPLQSGRALSYFLYFYAGYGIHCGSFELLKPKRGMLPALCCLWLYIAGFTLDNIVDINSLTTKTIGGVAEVACGTCSTLSCQCPERYCAIGVPLVLWQKAILLAL